MTKLYQCPAYLYCNYILLEESTLSLGKKNNCNNVTIYNWLKKYDIPRRLPSEAGKIAVKHKRSKNLYKKGRKPPLNEIKIRSEKLKGERNGLWKGDNVGYVGLHRWIRYNFPHNNICEKCFKIENNLDLANISGNYTRNKEDYLYLCKKCHREIDKEKYIKYRFSFDQLHYYYITKKLTVKQIAKIFFCGTTTINKNLKKYNIYKMKRQ